MSQNLTDFFKFLNTYLTFIFALTDLNQQQLQLVNSYYEVILPSNTYLNVFRFEYQESKEHDERGKSSGWAEVF